MGSPMNFQKFGRPEDEAIPMRGREQPQCPKEGTTIGGLINDLKG